MGILSILTIKKESLLIMAMQFYAFSSLTKDTLQQDQKTKQLIFIQLRDKKLQLYADILHPFAVYL